MEPSLLKRYEQEWKKSVSTLSSLEIQDERPTNPLLINLPENSKTSKYRIMVFGQETNDWEDTFPHSDGINHILNVYSGFLYSEKNSNRRGQFWNGVSRLRKELAEKLDVESDAVEIIWNNLVKIGKDKDKGKPNTPLLEWQDNWFNVIAFEVEVLEPDIVIFFTGPYYDEQIIRIFPDVSFRAISEKTEGQLASVQSLKLPLNSVRTYHPNYLYRNNFYDYLEDIMGAIK